MFAKSTLASAVAAALGVSAVGIQTAQADTIFLPYIGVGPTVTTVITTINTATFAQNHEYDAGSGDTTRYLHYRLYYKQANVANERLNPCVESDILLPTSYRDIQTFDLGGIFGTDTQSVLFNDPSVKNNYKLDGRSFALASESALGVSPVRGYLTVDNRATAGNTLAGEAFAFDFENGAVWGYQGLPQTGLADRDVLNDGLGLGADYRFAASASATMVPFMPFAETTTAFFVTPVSRYQMPPTGNSYRARVYLSNTYFDRDENPLSGITPVDVVCVGRVNATELFSDAGKKIPNGGWGYLNNTRVVPNAPGSTTFVPAYFTAESNPATDASSLVANSSGGVRSGAVVIKLDYNTGGTFNGEAVDGVYNNGFVLRPDVRNGTWPGTPN